MAATIAKAYGHDSSRVKETHRLGSRMAVVEAATWRTFALAEVKADGSAHVEIRRDGVILHTWTVGPEGAR